MQAIEQYSSAQEEEEQEETRRESSSKRRKLEEDVPKFKVRSFPHVEGNYATHVYLEVQLPTSAKQDLKQIIQQARSDLPLLQTGTDVLPPNNQPMADIPSNLHVSLSRVVVIRHPDIQPLLDTLREALKKTKRFDLSLTELEVFTNDEKERTFLALKVDRGSKEVCTCIRRVNKAFLQHGLQVFYQNPRPHVSFAWLLGSEEQAVESHIKKVKVAFDGPGMAWRDATYLMQVSSVTCKIGRQVYDVWKALD